MYHLKLFFFSKPQHFYTFVLSFYVLFATTPYIVMQTLIKSFKKLNLKGLYHEIFDLWVFHQTTPSRYFLLFKHGPSMTAVKNQNTTLPWK